jgi:hypothetical protein
MRWELSMVIGLQGIMNFSIGSSMGKMERNQTADSYARAVSSITYLSVNQDIISI